MRLNFDCYVPLGNGITKFERMEVWLVDKEVQNGAEN